MLKALFNWKVLLNIALAIGVFIGLVWLTFRWLEFHTNHGKEIEVPNVTNLSVQKAIEVLDNTGLNYEIDSFSFDPKYRPFQVLQVYPTPGSRVKGGSPIRLKVNPRTWAPVSIPDIVDVSIYRAVNQLQLVGLKVGDTLYEPSIAKDAVLKLMLNGKVLKPGEMVPRFSIVDIVVGQGPKRNVPVPNLVGYTLQEAQNIIKQNYFEPGLFYDEHEQNVNDPSLIVFYQNPSAGSISDQGVQIDLWVSKKTPAEMSAKINELDNIYRRNVTPDPSYTDPGPSSFGDDDFDTPPPPVKRPVEKPKPTNTASKPKPAATTATTEKKPAPTNEQKPKPEQKPAEKPKEKKKVIIE